MIDFSEFGVSAFAPDLPEVVVVKRFDTRFFQFENRVLTKVHVNRINVIGAAENVIQRVAAGAGNYHDIVRRLEFQGDSV